MGGLSAPETLRDAHDVSAFACGKPALDNWLRNHAKANQSRGFTAVVVVHDGMRVAGYYGLAPTAVDPSHLPRTIRTGQPPNPVPCLLLGQLACDQAYAGRGVGTGLLKHAFLRCVATAALVGGRALVVHAIDDSAAAFWLRRGFTPAKSQPMMMFRPIAAIAASIIAAEPPA